MGVEGGLGYLVFHLAGWVVGRFVPDYIVRAAYYGAKGVGKSSMRTSTYNGFHPVHQHRIETTQMGQRGKVKVWLENGPRKFRDYRSTVWDTQDIPHQAEFIPGHFAAISPRIVIWMLSGKDDDVHPWNHDYNKKIIRTIVEVVKEQYKKTATTFTIKRTVTGRAIAKKKKPTGNRCRYVIMMVNKMDDWPPNERAERAKKIFDLYEDELDWFRDPAQESPEIIYMCASLKEGNYIPYWGLHDKPYPLPTFFEHMMKLLIQHQATTPQEVTV